jgi:hypothetical protein
MVPLADKRVVVRDVGKCADREICAGGDGELAVRFCKQYGTVPKRGGKWRKYLDIIRLWSHVDIT